MKEEIKLLSAHMRRGDTLRTTCPSCGGGSSGEASLSITKDEEGVVYYCFRASCPVKGSYRSKPNLYVQDEAPSKEDEADAKRMAAFNLWDETVTLPGGVMNFLTDAFGRAAVELLYPRYHLPTDRVMYPCMWRGRMRGFVARSYSGARPKSLSYKMLDKALIARYTAHENDYGLHTPKGVIVVEDMPSAATVAATSRDVIAVALNGTNTTEEGWLDIQDTAGALPVCIVLDADAQEKGVRLMMRHKHRFQSASSYMIHKDFKDMNPKERGEIVNSIIERWRSE